MERRLRALVPLAVSAALLLSTGRASAEEQGPWPQFRMDISVEGGAFIFPGFGTSAVFSVPVALAGIQFNKLLGLCAGMDVDILRGKVEAKHFTFPLVVELTFGDRLLVGAGPDLGWYATNVERGLVETTRTGLAYGGRFYLALRAAELGNGKRTMLTFGLALRLRGGGPGFADPAGTTMLGPRRALAISPMFSIGITGRNLLQSEP